MSRLVDPGRGLPPAAAKQAREAAWRRPSDPQTRAQLRDERIVDALAQMLSEAPGEQ